MTQTSVKRVELDSIRYRVVRTLGAGAGSMILLVHESNTGRPFALKVVKRQSPEDEVYLDQAEHEADILRKLDHPSIIKLYDCRVRKSWFKITSVELLLEYVNGRTLDELDQRDIGQLVLVFIHVASALNQMHRRGIAHGDLKPGNIMLSRNGQVKVIDFGTAWLKGEPKGRIQGTPQYMAPEQTAEKLVDDRTDLYNLGATMYRMFTGQHANFGLGASVEVRDFGILAKVKPPIQLLADFPPELNKLIMACLERERANRPADIGDVKQSLVSVARQLGLRPEDLHGSEYSGEQVD